MTKTITITLVSLFLGVSIGLSEVRLENPDYTWEEIAPETLAVTFTVDYLDNETGEPIQHFQDPLNITGSPSYHEVHPELFIDVIGDAEYSHVLDFKSSVFDTSVLHWHLDYDCLLLFWDQYDFVDYSLEVKYVYPSFAQDSEGNVHVAWMDDRHGNWEIYYSKVYPDTEPPVHLEDLTIPDIPISAIDGRTSGRFVDPGYIYIWDEGFGSTSPTAPERGMTTIPPQLNWPDILIPYREKPRIAVDDDDDVHIVWSEKIQVRGPETVIYGDDGSVSLQTHYPIWAVFYSKLSNDGAVLVSPTRISETLDHYTYPLHACSPSIACQGTEVHIVWQQMVNFPKKQWEIFYSNGSEVEQATESDGYDSWYPDIAVDEDRNCYVVWQDGRDGSWQVYGKGYLPGECVYIGVEDARLSDCGGNNICPRVDVIFYSGFWPPVTECTVAHVTWASDVNGNWDIYYEMSYNYFWLINCIQQEDKGFEYYSNGNDVRITDSGYPDVWSVVAVKEDDPDGYPDIKYQSLDSLSPIANWEIYNAEWSLGEFINVVLINGPDTTSYPLFQTDLSDQDATDGVNYNFSLAILEGNYNYYIEAQNSEETYTMTSIMPLGFDVCKGGAQSQDQREKLSFSTWVYPNPLNSSTHIYFVLPVDSRVRLQIYNLAGQLVETVIDESMEAGPHVANWNTQHVPSGVYFYQLQAEERLATEKITVLR